MYALGLIVIAYLVGPFAAIPIGYGLDTPFGYYSGCYQPSAGSTLLRSLLPSASIGNIYPANYLSSSEVVGPDVLSTIPVHYGYNSPYASPRTANFAKGNYIRDYVYGPSEVGIRDQISVRSYPPTVLPPYSRVCSYLPIGICMRGINRFPTLPVEFEVTF